MNLTSKIEWKKINLLNGFEHDTTVQVSKDNNGWVCIRGAFSRNTPPQKAESIFVLEKEFWPTTSIPIILAQCSGASATSSWTTYGWIDTSGKMGFTGGTMPVNYRVEAAIIFNTIYKAQ